MKKLLLFIGLVTAITSFAQFPNSSKLGTSTTLLSSKGGFISDSALLIAARDTTNHPGNSYAGAVTYFNGSLWLRVSSPKKWVQLADVSNVSVPTWQQSLIAGSTLTQANTINGGNNRLVFSNLNTFDLTTDDTLVLRSTNSDIVLRSGGDVIVPTNLSVTGSITASGTPTGSITDSIVTISSSNVLQKISPSRINSLNTLATVNAAGNTTSDSMFINNTLVTNKHYNGGADTLFESDPYTTAINNTKTGFVHHYYGISNGIGTNGGGDITFYKESGGAGYSRLPVIADRRVLPGQEIWYHQYSAHNGVDSIYSNKSIAAIVKVQPSSYSTLGNMKGWYEVTTANDSGYKNSIPAIDFLLTQQKAAFNAPLNVGNNDLLRTMSVYGSGIFSDTLLTRVANIGSGGVNYNQYVNSSNLNTRLAGASFDVFRLLSGTSRPITIQGNSTHLPLYVYTDASSAGFTISNTQQTGFLQYAAGAGHYIANAEIFRTDNGAGPRLGLNTGSALNATFHVKGSTSSTRAFLVTSNADVELLRVDNGGNVILNPTTSNTLIGTTTDVPSSKFTIASTTQGMLPPRMTTAQRDAISSPATGLMVYDTTVNKVSVYNGTSWKYLLYE